MNRITELFGIKYPIIQGGMVWISGWRLAAAVSNAGGLGLLGAGSMHPEVLSEHIDKLRAAVETTNPQHPRATGRLEDAPNTKNWGVNLPLMYPEIDKVVDLIIEKQVPVVFTSAGSPKKYTKRFKDAGIKVVHVVSSSKFAMKCEEAGVDAIVAEGFEAGGHNGREELTTMCLIPEVCKATTLPVIAAGGIGSGRAMKAAMTMGAEGVQIGTLFAVSEESSASDAFKQKCLETGEDGTMLTLKKIAPARLIKNELYQKIAEAEARGADVAELRELLGQKSTKRGIFEGEVDTAELEIGQCVSAIHRIEPAGEIVQRLVAEYNETKNLPNL